MGNFVTAIDFGSSKIAVAVGERTASGIRILSYNDAPTTGVRGGEIINDMKVIETLGPLVRKAEDECGEQIDNAVISLSGKFIRSREITARYVRKDIDKYVDEDEIKNLTAEQFSNNVGDDDMIFEVIPQKFNVDDQIGLRSDEVIGMRGSVIEGFYKVFYGKETLFTRRKKILAECGIAIRKFVLSPVASAASVLTRQEMENGVALVDIGKGLTEIAIVKDNVVRDIAIVPFGGDAITNDVKSVTNLTYEWSENLKLRFGNCLEEYTQENKQLVLRGEDNVEEGSVELTLLSRIIEARMSEILDAVAYVIANSGYGKSIPSGVVLTGGTGYMEHVMQLAKIILGKKVRLAAPRSSITQDSAMGAMDAFSSTAAGLVIEGLAGKLSYTTDLSIRRKVEKPAQSGQSQASGKRKDPLFGSLGNLFGDDDEAENKAYEEVQKKKRQQERAEKAEARKRKKEEDEFRIQQEEMRRAALEAASAAAAAEEEDDDDEIPAPPKKRRTILGFLDDLFEEKNDKA